MSSTVYENLLHEIVTVVELLTDTTSASTTTEAKRKLVQATNAFKEDIGRAKEGANNLQGGELSVEDQEDIIETLEKLKNRKKATLNKFTNEIAKQPQAVVDGTSMQVDSTASTPAT